MGRLNTFNGRKSKHELPEPLGFQGIGIFRMKRRFKGNALNADDIGLGKTMQFLHAALPFRRKRPIVVVVPNSVKYQWDSEVKKHTGLFCWVLEGTKPPTKIPAKLPPIIILNWEILQYWVDFLIKLKPSVLGGDEIHYIKNRGTLRSKAFKKLAKKVDRIYGLSGSPFENCPRELFVILNILRPDIFPTFRPFGDRFCDPKYTPWGIKYDGATRIPELRRLLKQTCMIRRTKQQVMKDLPPITRTTIPLKINQKKYQEAERDILAWVRRYKPNKAYKTKYANHLAKFNYLLQLTAEMKLPKVIDWIDNFLATNNKKLTVFAHHRSFLEALQEKYGNQAVLIYGGMSRKKRRYAIDAFCNNPKIRVFLGGITAVGTGTDRLQTVCSDMVIAELIWVGLKLLQVEGRLWRIGQFNPVSVFYLVAQRTVETTLCKAVMRKQKWFNELFDGDSTKQEFDIFNTVIKEVKKKMY